MQKGQKNIIPLHTPEAVRESEEVSASGAHHPVHAESSTLSQSPPSLPGRITTSISPISLSMAFYDWAAHLAAYPTKRQELSKSGMDKWLKLTAWLQQHLQDNEKEVEPIALPKPHDRRFKNGKWKTWPFNFYEQTFLLGEEWWDEATKNIRGVSQHHLEMVNFATRQWWDMWSPSNMAGMNPEVIDATLKQGGQNFVEGYKNYLEDLSELFEEGSTPDTEKYQPGKDIATTPGKVIYRNQLMELIQYSPTTEQVFAEPILIIPAWIMKYYILDLSPHNSLVKYLVDQGHTVFMISWKNPDAQDRDLGFEDYLSLGIEEALKVVQTIIPKQKIHTVGYCLGGTLLMIAAAAMAKRKDNPIQSISLFAAQVDYEEAGELMLFIDESQIAAMEDRMWQQGYLDKKQMAGAFNMLRPNDLIWSRLIRRYFLGKRMPLNDLMAWNADATRMPFKMHSQYLRQLYLNNELSEGHFKVKGKPIALTDIKAPIFAVGTVQDHVAPWLSVYKVNLYTDTDVTFVLTSGGHNAGVVCPPSHCRNRYQIATQHKDGSYLHPSAWAENIPSQQGSWWPEWQTWLGERSTKKTTPPSMGRDDAGYAPLDDAPGNYVQKG